MKIHYINMILLLGMGFLGCEALFPTDTVATSISAKMISFSFLRNENTRLAANRPGNISGNLVEVQLPYAEFSNNKKLIPHIEVPAGHRISPDSKDPQNFSSPVTYTITSPTGHTTEIVVRVNIASRGFTSPKLSNPHFKESLRAIYKNEKVVMNGNNVRNWNLHPLSYAEFVAYEAELSHSDSLTMLKNDFEQDASLFDDALRHHHLFYRLTFSGNIWDLKRLYALMLKNGRKVKFDIQFLGYEGVPFTENIEEYTFPDKWLTYSEQGITIQPDQTRSSYNDYTWKEVNNKILFEEWMHFTDAFISGAPWTVHFVWEWNFFNQDNADKTKELLQILAGGLGVKINTSDDGTDDLISLLPTSAETPRSFSATFDTAKLLDTSSQHLFSDSNRPFSESLDRDLTKLQPNSRSCQFTYVLISTGIDFIPDEGVRSYSLTYTRNFTYRELKDINSRSRSISHQNQFDTMIHAPWYTTLMKISTTYTIQARYSKVRENLNDRHRVQRAASAGLSPLRANDSCGSLREHDSLTGWKITSTIILEDYDNPRDPDDGPMYEY